MKFVVWSAIAVTVLAVGGTALFSGSDMAAEKANVERAINDCIMWPYPQKNIERLYTSSNFLCYSRTSFRSESRMPQKFGESEVGAVIDFESSTMSGFLDQ